MLSASPTKKDSNRNSQVCLGSANKHSQLPLILARHLLKSDNGSRLLLHDVSAASFTLHDDVGDTHLAAQSGEEDDELDGVDVMRDDDECGFLGFNQGNDVVEAVLDEERFLGVLLTELSEVKRLGGMTIRGNERTLASFSFSLAADTAAAVKRAFFSCFDSGRYLFNSLNNCVAVFLSSVCKNWAMAGGTLRCWCRMTFCLWRRTYSGHLTKRVRSVWGQMSCPVRGSS